MAAFGSRRCLNQPASLLAYLNLEKLLGSLKTESPATYTHLEPLLSRAGAQLEKFILVGWSTLALVISDKHMRGASKDEDQGLLQC